MSEWPHGPKLFERSLLVAHRTKAVGGEPAEVWALNERFDDPGMMEMFEDQVRFLDLHRMASLPRPVVRQGRELVVAAPPWIALDTIQMAAHDRGGIDRSIVVTFLRDLARDLASHQGVVVRSFTPHTLALTITGKPRILDLTLARFAEKHASRRRATTASGVLKGELSFLSPELATGRRFDDRSDVFVLALVAIELLTGSRVFVGEPLDVLGQIRNLEINARDRCYREPKGLRVLLEDMLTRDPTYRPSMTDVADAIDRELSNFVWTPERVADEIRRVAPTQVEEAVLYGF